jgi:hypothetical protein
MAKIMAREYSGITGNVGTLAWVSEGFGGAWCWRRPVEQSCLRARQSGRQSEAPFVVLFSFQEGHPVVALLQAAPEMLLGARCTEKADIYSFGRQRRLLLQACCPATTCFAFRGRCSFAGAPGPGRS